MKIAAISDTHCSLSKFKEIDPVDFLVHAGDLTYRGSFQEVAKELSELERIGKTAKYIILIAGNHDWGFQKEPKLFRLLCEERNILYLENEELILEGTKFYGSPVTPVFFTWAFMYDRGEQIRGIWDRIPEDVDVLITHGPPNGILDYSIYGDARAGCEELRKAVYRIKPKVHIFGHLHMGTLLNGMQPTLKIDKTTFVNAAMLNDDYVVCRKPVYLEI